MTLGKEKAELTLGKEKAEFTLGKGIKLGEEKADYCLTGRRGGILYDKRKQIKYTGRGECRFYTRRREGRFYTCEKRR